MISMFVLQGGSVAVGRWPLQFSYLMHGRSIRSGGAGEAGLK